MAEEEMRVCDSCIQVIDEKLADGMNKRFYNENTSNSNCSRGSSSRLRCTAVAAEQKTEAPGLNLLKWLREQGAAQDKVELRTLEVPAAGERHMSWLLVVCTSCALQQLPFFLQHHPLRHIAGA